MIPASLLALALLAAPAEDPCKLLEDLKPTYRGEVAPGFLLTLNAPGDDYRYHPDADDQGPPDDVKACMRAATGANVTELHVDWHSAEPNPPVSEDKRSFDFTDLRKRLEKAPKGNYLLCFFGLGWGDVWMEHLKKEDGEKWWRLAEGFMTEAARAVRTLRPEPEEIYYHAPGNEPSLTGKPDWAFTYMRPVIRWYGAIKRADERNRLLVGALVVGRRSHIGELYRAGLKGHFDVLNIHSYDDTGGKAFFSLSQVIETRQVLVEHGDGDKPIWLGEGWAPFPLPEHIDRREDERYRQGLGMSMEPYTYTPEDIEHYRKAVIRGWYNLMTPRKTYDPKWVLGVSYFCLNDMWGSVGWKKRAIPHYDDQGNIEWWNLDGYHIPYAPHALEPKYRPWGIIDAYGRPKGDIVVNFPPYLPKHRFEAVVEAPMEGHVVQMITGRPYTVTLNFTSEEEPPYENCRFSMDTREDNRDRGVRFRALDDPKVGDLKQGESTTRKFEVIFPPELVGKEICVLGELHYIWADRVPYYASAWLNVQVLPAAGQGFRQSKAVAADRDTPIKVSVELRNETASIFSTFARPVADPALVFEPREYQVNLLKGESKVFPFKVRLAPDAAPGTYPFKIDTGSSLSTIESEVTFALPSVDPGENEWGLLHNGGFEEAAGERGHRNWSGNMTDWDTGDALDDLEGRGQRCVTYAANGVTPRKVISQTISWPPPGGRAGPLMAFVYAKGVGFDLDATPRDTTFQLRLVALDANGEALSRDESPVFKGSGEWEQLEHRFSAPPEETHFIRFEIESAIERAAGWHLHHLDQARLVPD